MVQNFTIDFGDNYSPDDLKKLLFDLEDSRESFIKFTKGVKVKNLQEQIHKINLNVFVISCICKSLESEE